MIMVDFMNFLSKSIVKVHGFYKIKNFILKDEGSKLEAHLKNIKKTKESLNR